ncbi:MAG: DEAD/DEAH box helicase, partial [Brevundimonas sp.]
MLADPIHSDPLAEARATLHRVWGHADFRGRQAQVVEAALEGRDVMAVLPTGGGKSVCYQIPAM